MRARAHIEELRGGKNGDRRHRAALRRPQKGGDDGVIKKIADLVKEGSLTEVADLKDHSDKSGMRIEVELKRDAIPQVALNKLFKHTPLQTTFGYNAVALVDGVPKTLVAARAAPPLPRPPARGRHAPARSTSCARPRPARTSSSGYLIALDNLDAVIALIRAAADTDDARAQLMARFELSRDPGAGDPRPAPPRADRARAQASRGRVRRPAGADRRAARDPRRRARIDARDPEELLEIKAIYGAQRRPPHRDRRGRGASSSSRT